MVNGGTVKNFYISGTITIDGKYSHIGGAVGNAKGDDVGNVKSSAVISGIVSDVNISGVGAAKHKATPVKEWNTGSVAYILNGGLYNNTYTWRQTIGKDTFPNFTGDMVYRNGKNSFTSEKPSTFIFFDGDTITAEQVESPCVLIAASYNSGGKLIDVKMKSISGNRAVTRDEMKLDRQDANRVCAMLWSNRETMIPICNAAEQEPAQRQE